ncbi:hypothetical protein ABZ770_41245 [Streptomyces sp. NPDC006654]|uniref:hypothetical protein n=1 Tax=Streptomyces sp. NPDC006654 TaxID=3156897 RepID=UPI0033C5C4FD
MLEEKLDALSQMMAEHMANPFPPGFRGRDVLDQDRCCSTRTPTLLAPSKARSISSATRA